MDEIYKRQVAKLFEDNIRYGNSSFDDTGGISLGRGSFGDVLLRYHHELGNVAVKSLDVSVSRLSEKLLEELSHEINILKAARSPNIICLLGVIVEQGHHALVMEYARYKSLHDIQKYLKSESVHRIPGCLLGRMMMETSSGLAYLHLKACGKKTILHNDIKPENILIAEGLHAKIGDFGLSKIQNSLSSVSCNNVDSSVGGTMDYIDPRLLYEDDTKPTRKSDIYSLGITFLELAGGKKVFEERVAHDIMRENCVRLKQFKLPYNNMPVSYPSFLEKIIKQCTSYVYDERPECSDISEQLKLEMVELQDSIRMAEDLVYKNIDVHYGFENHPTIDGSDTFDIADKPSTPSPKIDRGDGPSITDANLQVHTELIRYLNEAIPEGSAIFDDLLEASEAYLSPQDVANCVSDIVDLLIDKDQCAIGDYSILTNLFKQTTANKAILDAIDVAERKIKESGYC